MGNEDKVTSEELGEMAFNFCRLSAIRFAKNIYKDNNLN